MGSGCPHSEHLNSSAKIIQNAVHRIFTDFNMNILKSDLNPLQENIQ